MRQTKAQRLNKSYDAIWDAYEKDREATKDLLPTCSHYSHYLSKAVEKFKISIDEARSKYGQYTYGQWRDLLGI